MISISFRVLSATCSSPYSALFFVVIVIIVVRNSCDLRKWRLAIQDTRVLGVLMAHWLCGKDLLELGGEAPLKP